MKTLWEKGENAGHQHFLLFPTMFSTGFTTNLSIDPLMNFRLQTPSNWCSIITYNTGKKETMKATTQVMDDPFSVDTC